MSPTEATTAAHLPYFRTPPGKNKLAAWLLTTDHKRIGVMYLFSILIFFLFAVVMGVLIRLELWSPGVQFLDADKYNRVLTLHGMTMIFLFIIPVVPAVFGNFFLPIMLGANDVAFPRLNLLSWYGYVGGGLFAIVSVMLWGPDTGWTFYVPYSVSTKANVFFPLTAVVILGFSSILTGLNFITTVHRLRAPTMGWFKMPLFIWSLYATSWVQLLATPVIAITLVLLLLERFFHIGLFDPTRGGDAILYQHLFWIYSHPAVYIMILPAMGVVSEVIPTFSRKTIFGYKYIAASSIAIASIGSLVWGHHMFTSGMADYGRIVFSFLTFLVAVPSGIKVFNWVSTLYKGSIQITPTLVFALFFIFLFSIGGLTGLIQGGLATNLHIHDTAFIVGHFHYVMFGGAGVMFFAALYYWFPKMTGKMYPLKPAWIAMILFFIGFNLLYFALILAGLAGMPRRYADYPPEYTSYHRWSTIGSWIMVPGILLLLGNLAWALWKGSKAPANPWGGATLEWEIPAPPAHENFPQVPELTRGPYEYPDEVKD